MMQFNNVKMESIFYSLNELKHEKQCLAQKLQEQKMQKQAFEQDLEQVSTKYNQGQEKHRRMSETLAVAQHKINESLSTVSLLENKVSTKPGIDCIQRAIHDEKQLNQDTISQVESSLSSISNQLFKARDFHKMKALQNEITRTQKLNTDLKNQMEVYTKRIQQLNHKLDKLIRDENCGAMNKDYPTLRLKVLFELTERDYKEMKDHMHKLQTELQSVHNALRDARLLA